MSQPAQQGPFRLDGKVAAITGAGAGIGAAIAHRFASQGCALALLDIDVEAAQKIVAELEHHGTDAEAIACDVSRRDQVAAAFLELSRRFGGLDILVNNAGIGHVGTAVSTTEQDFDRLFAVNVKGVFFCTQQALPLLQSRGKGVVCNLASIASLIGVADRFAYSMTKGAVLTMTKSVAVDYLQHGIRCNCVCPARVHTRFVDNYLQQNYPGKEQEMFQKLSLWQPAGRMAMPQEVADLVLYLCSDEAAFVTGQAVPLDGGKLVF
jgi:NAD(P)-dependent dehydrogenase (short-subunit alcohol dehydrogenase family)